MFKRTKYTAEKKYYLNKYRTYEEIFNAIDASIIFTIIEDYKKLSG